MNEKPKTITVSEFKLFIEGLLLGKKIEHGLTPLELKALLEKVDLLDDSYNPDTCLETTNEESTDTRKPYTNPDGTPLTPNDYKTQPPFNPKYIKP